MRAVSIVILGAALALAGCGNLLGLDDPHLTDAGGDDDGGPDADMTDASPADVTGRSYYRYISAGGSTDVAIDLSTTVVQVLVPDAGMATGFRIIDGTGNTDGSFTIPNVPTGTYYLKIGTSYYVTDARTIDRRFDVALRMNTSNAGASTFAAFSLTQMQAFANGPDLMSDTLEIHSLANAYVGGPQNVPLQGATTYAESYDWRWGSGIYFGGYPLPVMTEGDDLQVVHMHQEKLAFGGHKLDFNHLVDWFQTSVTIANGATTPVTGSFVNAAQDHSAVITFPRGQYDTAYNGIAPGTGDVVIWANPAATGDWGITLAQLSFNDWSRSTTTTVTGTLPYGDPVPVSWTRTMSDGYAANRFVLVPGTTSAALWFGGTSRYRALPTAGGTISLAPSVQPPSTFRIEGADAVIGGKVAFDGMSPVTLTWSPVAGVRYYQVLVRRAYADGTRTRLVSAGSFSTRETTLEVPAEVITGGEFFVFSVAAIQANNDYAGGEVSGNGYSSVARMPSGLFRMSSRCGNGAVDSGEQCDTSGESATCDVDCSTPACGDGLRNAAAGETCDYQLDVIACDSDCTAPVCGDGHINPTIEDCDDGNTIDNANGCSTMCKFNNICGDGVVQMLAEQCDGGTVDTATCDRDCTLAVCGDGHLNTAAGEACDLGFNNGSGTCSATCTVM